MERGQIKGVFLEKSVAERYKFRCGILQPIFPIAKHCEKRNKANKN